MNIEQCISDCSDCYRSCTETVVRCLEMGGKHAAPDHIRLMLDCAEICRTSAGFMMRGSPLHERVCGVCADICERCAADCDGLSEDEPEMADCAATCRRCARTCREMAGAAVA